MISLARPWRRASAKHPRRPVASRLTALGWIALLTSFVCTSSLLWQRPLPVALYYGLTLMACLSIAVWYLPIRLRQTRGSWILPRSVHAGEEVTVGARLHSGKSTPPVSLSAWDPSRQEQRHIADLPGLDFTPTRVAWVVRFPQRGHVDLPVLRLHSEQPFGLVAGSVGIGDEQTMIVYPTLGQLQHGVEQRLQRWVSEGARSNEAGDDEFAHLRDYRPGDPPRQVHWKASAKARRLLIGERQAPVARRLAIAIDCTVKGPRSTRLERLLSIAATLIDHLLHSGWTISVHGACAGPMGVVGDRDALMSSLACVEPKPASDVLDYLPVGVPTLALLLGDRDLQVDSSLRVMVMPLTDAEQWVHLPRSVR